MVTTILARRAQFHQTMLAYHTTPSDLPFENQLNGLSRQLVASGASPADAQGNALARLYQGMLVQAQTLAYIDVFLLLAIAAAVMFVLTFVVRKNDPGGGGEVAVG
jgi:DHA2 family multidrug resistance protein